MIRRIRRDKGISCWKKTACILLCAAAMLCAGCAGQESGEGSASGQQGMAQAGTSGEQGAAQAGISGEQGAAQAGVSGEQSAARAGAITQGGELFFNEYLPFDLKEPEAEVVKDRVYGDIYGGRLYILSVYGSASPEGESKRVCLLNVFDGETRQMEQKPFALELPGGEDFYIDSMEAVGQEELSFRVKKLSDMDGDGYLVRTDLEGKLLGEMEAFPDASAYPWNGDWMGRMVFDTGGKTILCEWDYEEGSKLYWIDPEDGGRRLLASLDGEVLYALCLEKENSMYYIGNGSLIHWDMEANARQELMEISELGMPNMPDFTGLLVDSNGEVLVCSLAGDALGVYVLSEEETETEEEIRLACIYDLVINYPTKLAAQLSRQHMECPIEIERNGGDQEAYRDRILMELTAGRGPEMMWVSKADMEILAEKGVLMDMQSLIPEDIMEQLWPGVVADTTIDGRMVGLALCFETETTLVSDQIWAGETWTTEDVMECIGRRDDWNWLLATSLKMPPYPLFLWLTGGWEESPFLDPEQGNVQFDRPEFTEILEVCRQYGEKAVKVEEMQYQTWEEAHRMMREGESVAELSYIADLESFSQTMERCAGDGLHLVGSPTDTGSGNYVINPNGYLVVNREAEHLDIIREYIALLLDYENQFTVYGNSVRRDVIQDSVVRDEHDGKLWQKMGKNGDTDVAGELTLKADGTSYLEEYMAYLESCVPESRYPSGISAIMLEELQPYFAGDKSVEDTVRILQNRVQLYLDEGNL